VSAGWGWQQWGGGSNGGAAPKSQQQQLRRGSSADQQLKPWDDNSWSEDDGWDDLEHGKKSPPSKVPSLDAWSGGGGIRQGSGVNPAHVTGFSPRGGTPSSRPRGATAAAAANGGSNGSQNKLPRQRSPDASEGW
jgi:hypothetical protein